MYPAGKMLQTAITCIGILVIAHNCFIEAFRLSIHAPKNSPVKSISHFMGAGSDFQRGNEAKIQNEVSEKTIEEDSEKQAYLEELKISQTNEISDGMRRRLLKEMKGNDPNFSRGPVLGNPILLISVVVAILILLGGKDILF